MLLVYLSAISEEQKIEDLFISGGLEKTAFSGKISFQ